MKNVPAGATHQHSHTGDFYVLIKDSGYHHITLNGTTAPQPSVLLTGYFLGLQQEQPKTLHERLTDVLGVETDDDIVTHVTALQSAAAEQETVYWDGVEPLRVGHITKGGTVEVYAGSKCCIRNSRNELFLVTTTNLKPHPLATLSETERTLVARGVVCLPS